MKLFDDTIIGISTALSKGAISIIRLSGDDAIKIVNKVFKGIDLSKVEPNTINYGHIVDFDSCQIIDEVLVSIFKAPKSYTKEDVVEINCHGGLFVTNKIYEQLVLLGARPSEPGEFTKRAFLSGRIDLTKAEAVMDVINAENSAALKIANSTNDILYAKENFNVFIKELNFAYESEEDPEKLNYILKRYIFSELQMSQHNKDQYNKLIYILKGCLIPHNSFLDIDFFNDFLKDALESDKFIDNWKEKIKFFKNSFFVVLNFFLLCYHCKHATFKSE